jgi:hypothetical protein
MPLSKEMGLLGMEIAVVAKLTILPHRLLVGMVLPPPTVVTTLPVGTLAVGVACGMITC